MQAGKKTDIIEVSISGIPTGYDGLERVKFPPDDRKNQRDTDVDLS